MKHTIISSLKVGVPLEEPTEVTMFPSTDIKITRSINPNRNGINRIMGFSHKWLLENPEMFNKLMENLSTHELKQSFKNMIHHNDLRIDVYLLLIKKEMYLELLKKADRKTMHKMLELELFPWMIVFHSLDRGKSLFSMGTLQIMACKNIKIDKPGSKLSGIEFPINFSLSFVTICDGKINERRLVEFSLKSHITAQGGQITEKKKTCS